MPARIVTPASAAAATMLGCAVAPRRYQSLRGPSGRSHHIQVRRQHPQGRCQRDAPLGHPRQEPRIQAHAVLQGIHSGGDRRRPSGRLLRVHGNPPAHGVHRLDDRREHTDGNRLILRETSPR